VAYAANVFLVKRYPEFFKNFIYVVRYVDARLVLPPSYSKLTRSGLQLCSRRSNISKCTGCICVLQRALHWTQPTRIVLYRQRTLFAGIMIQCLLPTQNVYLRSRSLCRHKPWQGRHSHYSHRALLDRILLHMSIETSLQLLWSFQLSWPPCQRSPRHRLL
jgi:hypothetical protein